jgi:hypothetical protein
VETKGGVWFRQAVNHTLIFDRADVGRDEVPLLLCGNQARDLKKSLDFYTKAVGMKVVNKGTMPHGGSSSSSEGKGRGRPWS